MKVTLITVCYNSGSTIEDTFNSICQQSYENIEYIVIDGGSIDNTQKIANKYQNVITFFLSEKDKGLYDAMNKGISMATGDIIGIINSDDVLFNNEIIGEVVACFDPDIDGVYGDVVFCKQDDLEQLTRFYSSKSASYSNLKCGVMPAHPSLYLRKECFEEIGVYSLDYKIAADFDFIVRLFSSGSFNLKYLEKNLVKMREGGVSTSGITANLQLNSEILHSLKKHGISSNWFWLLSKYPMKLWGVLKAKLQAYTP
ncbi:glycosyltransferase family 2 protein [Vibrio cyclitrophicus]